MAKSKLMIDNSRVSVTEQGFDPGDETGQHIHEYDYDVVPMKDGILKNYKRPWSCYIIRI